MLPPELREEGAGGGGAPPEPARPEAPASPAVRRRGGRRSGQGGREGRRKAKEFLDVAGEAFAHQVAISVWREAEAVLGSSPSVEEGLRRLRELGSFEDRGECAPLWRENWRKALERMGPSATPPERLGIVREAVLKSMEEEDEARRRAGRPLLIDDEEGRRFVDHVLGRLFEEAAGEIGGVAG